MLGVVFWSPPQSDPRFGVRPARTTQITTMMKWNDKDDKNTIEIIDRLK